MQNLENLQFGRFKVLSLLGTGGFAAVYRVIDTQDQSDKVIKLLAKDWMKNEKVVKSFLEEGTLARSFAHPNIIRVLEVGRIYGQPYYLMEYWSEITLKQWLENNPNISVSQISMVWKILTQVASALDYIHAKGLIHRDVKPGNVLISNEYETKLLDFGIAVPLLGMRLQDIQSSGTPQYMAPEQKQGKPLDVTVDSYAFAMVAREVFEKFEIKPSADTNSLLIQALSIEQKKRPTNLVQYTQLLSKSFEGNI